MKLTQRKAADLILSGTPEDSLGDCLNRLAGAVKTLLDDRIECEDSEADSEKNPHRYSTR